MNMNAKPANPKALEALCKQFAASPYATPLMDILDDAEERARRMGRAPHRIWRMQYEAARSTGKGIQDSVVAADMKMAELVGIVREKKLGARRSRKK